MTTHVRIKTTLAVLLQASLLLPMMPAYAINTSMPLADVPLDISIRKSNILFDMDNSGSMDWEIITNTVPSPLDLNSAIPWSNGRRVGHLFPTSDNDTDGITAGSSSYNTIAPPTSQFAYLRSPDFNKIYYNPKIDYAPWDSAYDSGSVITFANASPTAARSHPYILTNGNKSTTCTSSSSCLLLNLTVVNTDSIYVASGISIPSTVPGPSATNLNVSMLVYDRWGNASWQTVTSGFTSGNTGYYSVPNYPATYWLKDPTCTSSTYPSSDWRTCAAAPGTPTTMMRRYDIINDSRFAGSSFTLPDGTTINRTRAQELQNFANWYSYYRKRKLMAAGSIANTLDNLQKNQSRIVAGFVPYNTPSGTPSVYDFSLDDTTANAPSNGRALIAKFYTMLANGGTPGLGALSFSGNAYGYSNTPWANTTDSNAVLRCSVNTSIVVTDGFANDYSSNNSLYKIAKSNYDNMRWWSPFKAPYPSDTTYTTGNLGNTMNTYAITLGALGNKYGVVTEDSVKNTLQTDSAWGNPTNDDPSAIDDLWRATLYTRGKMLTATDPATLQAGMSSILASLIKASSDTNIAVSNVKVQTGDNVAVYGTYSPSDWTGDLKAYSIDLTTGDVVMTTPLWSAREILNARTADSRIIATWSGTKGIAFRPSDLDTAGLLSTFNTGSNSDGADVVNYLRGDKTKESDTYRQRNGILGDIVNSQPVYVAGAAANYYDNGYSDFKSTIASRGRTVYVGANDGMLHAFDASTGTPNSGKELWAYVPKLVHSKLNVLTKPAYQHKFTVDGRIAVWDANLGSDANPDWKTVLIGGLRHGGPGFYALDITTPVSVDETALASKVLWEFTDSTMGESYGKPVIVKTNNYGWVALLTSGYNNADGVGYLYVVRLKKTLESGETRLIKKIATPEGSTTNQVGLAQIAALSSAASNSVSSRTSGLVKWVYGGDLNGNVWRFDLSDNNADNWSVKKLAASLGGQPITAAPEIAYINTSGAVPSYTNAADVKDSRLMVYVGTGKLLHGNDLDTASYTTEDSNGFYAFEDANDSLVINSGDCANLACLVKNGLGQESTASLGLNNWGTISNASLASWWQPDKASFKLAGQDRVARGWYIKFSETGGERVITDPIAAYGFVAFTTSMKTDTRHGTQGACEATYSALYILAADKGGELSAEGKTPQSRWNLGFGVATTPAIFGIPTKVVATTCLQGNCQRVDPPVVLPSGNNTLKRYGWKEIIK